jgi:pimeloyl-ACP methyl ester carboxylesterase
MRNLRVSFLSQPGAALLLAIVALLAVLGITRAVSAKDGAHHDPRPTVVLVHGAWANPDAWESVELQLRERGFSVVAPRLELMSIEGDAAIVRQALDAVPGEKVLVGHSYGGIVVSNASAGRTDVRALVYTAAFVPEEGDSILTLGAGYPESAILHSLVWIGAPFASLSYLAPDHFREVFAADLSPAEAGIQNGGQQPSNPALLVAESGPVGWHEIPSWYAVSGADLVIDAGLQRWMAARAGASVIEFPAASHAGGFTVHAKAFAKLIERAVFETK